MTLALYGKSRRRQGALLTAALLAVIVATIGALSAITSAFAHSATITGVAECTNDGWKVTWTIKGDFPSKYMKVVSFTTDDGKNGTPSPNPVAPTYPNGSKDGQFGFQDSSVTTEPHSPSKTFVEATAQVYWYRLNQGGQEINRYPDSGLKTYKAKVDAPDCDRTIRIVKVTKGGGAPSTWSFSGTITNASPTNWTLSNSASSVDYVVPNNQTHTVTEATPGAGWILDGYRVLDSKKSSSDCGTKDSDYSGSAASVPSGTGDKTVCILNKWIGTGQLVLSEGSCVVQDGAAYAKFHFLIPSNANVPESSARTLSGTYNPGSASFGPVSEYSDANSHPDWFFTIPFGSNSSITLLTAQTSDGWTWPTTGAGRDKATVRNDCLPKGTLIVGKVKDPTAGVPAADGSQFSGTATNQGNAAVHNWGAITFGGFSTINNIPAGTYTLNETGTQNGWTPYGWAAGSLNQQGQPTCPSAKTSYTAGNPLNNVQVNANETKVVCVMNTKTAQVPSIDKVKASEGYSGGYAYWEIKVKNPSDWSPTVFTIEDSGVQFVSASNGTCSGILLNDDFSDGSIVCKADAGKTLVVKVKREVAPQCRETTVNNSVTVKKGVLFTQENFGSAGGTQATQYDIPGDPAKCDKPGITKTLVENGSSQTTDPNVIEWTVTVTNPNGTNGITRTVWIKDQNVTVASGPSYGSSGTSCTIPSGSTFEAQLNSTNGVQCTIEAGATITFTVKPKPTPQRTCEDQVFTNTAYLYVGSTTADPITAQGPAITLLGDKSLCKRDITICKVLEDNGDGYTRPAGTFVLTVNDGSQTTQYPLDAAEGGQAACKTVTVPANATVTVGETATRPTNWNGDASGYPKVTQNGDTYTVTNKEKPLTVEVTFVKKVCDTFKDVPKNNGSNLNHIGAPYFQGLTENDLGTTEGNCRTVDWKFQIWSANTSNNPWPGNNPSGTKLQDATTGANVLNSAALTELITKGQLFITELYEPNYAFAALKCEGDMVNQDNWEWLYWSQVKDDGKITCTAYNVPATKQITIQKKFYGASQVSGADYPTFTISDGVDFNAACTGPTLSGTNPVTATWTCTVPYLWNGTVTETPATGWERCAVVSAQVAGNGSQTQETFEFTNCKQPQIVVKKVVTNVQNDTTQFSVTLTGGQSSQTGQIAESSNSGPVNATFGNLPLSGSYTVTEQSQNGYQVLGWTYATENGTCPPQPANTGAVAQVAPKPGASVVICFYNERFGNVVVDKSVSTNTATPGVPFTWTITVSVADGPTSSALTLTDTLPPGFTYGSPSATSPLSCTLTAGQLSCTLPQNTPIGTYTVTIPATAPTGTFAICGEHTNTVSFEGAGIKGTDSATVTVGCVASDGTILVRKVVLGQPGDTTTFTAELTGPGISGTATQPFSQQNIGFFPGLSAGTFTVSEQPKPGYTYLGWAVGFIGRDTVECPANPTGTGSASVTLSTLAPNAAICFYNEARVTIRVHKTLNVVGFTSNGQGWQFTLTGCGITPQTKTTDANGIADFTDLPPAIGCQYTVTETVQAGWTPQFVSQTAQPVAGGQVVTLEFLNIKDFNPPCTDPNDPRCVPPPPPTPTPTATPTTPGATPTPTNTPTPTPTNTPSQPTATPTNTPSQPTATPTNTPVTQVAGERTPGPGQSPTPLAPATGFGFGQGEGGMSLLLVFAGLVSLSLGLGFLALGRRNR